MGPEVFENPIAGRYVAHSRIGAGSMGSVLRARDLQTGDTVAVKLLDADAGDTARARFRQEIETLAQLRAPGIVPLLAGMSRCDAAICRPPSPSSARRCWCSPRRHGCSRARG